MPPEHGRELTIDPPSIIWAFNSGRAARLETSAAGVKIRADRVCPFRPGTPHAKHWMNGWKWALKS